MMVGAEGQQEGVAIHHKKSWLEMQGNYHRPSEMCLIAIGLLLPHRLRHPLKSMEKYLARNRQQHQKGQISFQESPKGQYHLQCLLSSYQKLKLKMQGLKMKIRLIKNQKALQSLPKNYCPLYHPVGGADLKISLSG